MSDYVCGDLLALILKWLPVKALLRCRCVCKSWKQIIASNSFILAHLALQKPRILPQTEVFQDLGYDPRNHPLLHNLRIPDGSILCHFSAVSSVHGVVCLYDTSYLLLSWNPSIRQFLRVPLPGFPSCRTVNDFKYCGFCIDPSSNEFKIVIFSFKDENVSLLSTRKQLWMEIPMDCETGGFGHSDESTQVLIDGVAHWIAYTDCDYGVIILFDFGQDKFGTIELPRVLMVQERFGVNVCKWRGFLSVTHYD